MATRTWIGGHAGTPTSWNDALNWSSGIVPIDGDDVVINPAASEPRLSVNAASLQSLTLNASASLTQVTFAFIAASLTNAGTITGTSANGGASGAEMFGAGGRVTNSGTIIGDVNGGGVVLHAGGPITNSTSGLIQGGSKGVQSSGAAGTVTNAGTIQATGSAGIGVLFSDNGGVFDSTLTNSGTIIGNSTAVQFGAGNDLLKLLPGASFTGLVDGGGGTNTLELAAGTAIGRLAGLGISFTNFGTLRLDSDAQWTLAGNGSKGLGTIAITGFTALDTIDLTDLAFASVSGVFASNALVLTNATAQDTLHIQGGFASGDFRFFSDGSGGTNIQLTPFVIVDTTTGAALSDTSTSYSGPVAGIQRQLINVTTDSLNITSTVPNAFLRSGSGMDGLNVSLANGNNILDGSTGSNFLTGGTGNDMFYIDNRNPTSPVFSTIVNFHPGDNATVWGVNATDFKILRLDNQGAAGFKGIDLIFTAPNHIDTSFVLTGYTSADLTNGRLSQSFGTTPDLPGLPGSQYLTIHAN